MNAAQWFYGQSFNTQTSEHRPHCARMAAHFALAAMNGKRT